MKIDHVALQVEKPKEAAEWYRDNFKAEIIYADDTWSFVQFENIKLAFVVPSQLHRDGSKSIYAKDPFGNFYELIKYKEK